MKINTKLCNDKNYKLGRNQKIKYIVIHYTSNKNDTAENNAVYFEREITSTSAHYFVDESNIWQSVEDKNTAWHCGAKTYKHKYCRNDNSLGIEICMLDENEKIRQKSIDNAIILTKFLMDKYNIDYDNVLRHFDVTGKDCPAPMVEKPEIWQAFKQKLLMEDNEQMKIYKYVPDMPEWARDTFTRLYKAGIVSADSKTGELSVQESSLQPMVYLDRLTGGKIEKLSEILGGTK